MFESGFCKLDGRPLERGASLCDRLSLDLDYFIEICSILIPILFYELVLTCSRNFCLFVAGCGLGEMLILLILVGAFRLLLLS